MARGRAGLRGIAGNDTRVQDAPGAGLDHGAVLRFLKGEFRPARDACIELAVYFDMNPNELLQLAGYEPMPIFDLSLIDPDEFPAEVKRVAKALSTISDMSIRRQMCKAILLLLEGRADLVRAQPVVKRRVGA